MSHTNNKEVERIEEIVKEFLKMHYEPEHICETLQDEDGNTEKCWCKTDTVTFKEENGNWHGRFETVHHEQRKVLSDWLRTTLHQELQKAREEERERIEAIFKEHVPPHAMDLEDSVWLKRLLNKAFNHDKNV